MKKSKLIFLKCVLSATVMTSALYVGYGEKAFAAPVFSQWGEDGEEEGQFSFPQGMAIDQAGNLYVADTMNSRVQKFTSNGQFLQAWDIDGMVFGMPRAIAVDHSGLVYVNNGQGNIRVFQSDGTELRHWDDSNFLNAGVLGMAVDQQGNVYVSNAGLHQIRKYDPMGQTLLTWGARGANPGQFNAPSGIAVDRDGTIYIADPGNFRIQKFDNMGQYLGQWGETESAEPGKFSFPQALTFDQFGNLHVMETKNYRIQVLDPYGKSIRMWGKEGSAPGEFEVTFGVAADNAGNIYVDDSMLRRVQKFSLTLVSPQIVTTSNQATVTWSVVEGATDLELEWSQDGKSWSKKALAANETQTTIAALTDNTNYQFRLSANFAPGYRMASNLVEARTANLPVQPSQPDTEESSTPITPPIETKLTSTNGQMTLPVGTIGEVSLEDKIGISIPANATNNELKLTIEKVLNPQNMLNNKEVLGSSIFEVLKNFPENFSKPVTIALTFDPTSLKSNQSVAVFYYEDGKKEWIGVFGDKINGNRISVEANHFGKFAVLVVDKASGKPVTNHPTETPPTEKPKEVTISDIFEHWAEANIKQAISSGIVAGYPDDTFKPNHTVTRAEFAVMLMNTLKPEGAGVATTFSDSGEIGAWAQKAVAQAVQASIINGNEDGTFRPNAEVTRAEMAVMIARAMNLSIEANAATDFADDKDIPTWAKGSVANVKRAGIVQGKDANQFAAQDHATRAEAVTILLKMLAQKSK
ncbi:S-layer homology domain-containing protein [Paenibacillus marchantiophytorum]|uniref:S-layer homology domain-containing protein n=1 Tax=Paenibacillus marchantiophytorum TaxID=1619310 RepID=UPI00166E32F5|nr:S-layer homology domain-containing protein [Paenibacillus marchantiophytorum]